MTFLIRKKMPRRAALRGLFQGTAVSVALPFLDCVLNDSGTAPSSSSNSRRASGARSWRATG